MAAVCGVVRFSFARCGIDLDKDGTPFILLELLSFRIVVFETFLTNSVSRCVGFSLLYSSRRKLSMSRSRSGFFAGITSHRLPFRIVAVPVGALSTFWKNCPRERQ